MYGKYSLEYDRWANRYDPCKKEIYFINSLISLKGKRVLDLGCGTGRLTYRLAEYASHVVGIDNDPFSIDICKEKSLSGNHNNYFFVCEDMHSFKTEDVFDIIIFSWSLYQSKNMRLAIENAISLLNNSGSLIILQPFGGEQEDIFDIEMSRYEKSYSKIVDYQINCCSNLFYDVNMFDFSSCFMYKSIDDAIKLNNFFYKLFTGKALYDEPYRLHEITGKLKSCKNELGVFLNDQSKILICQGKFI